ncbi:MAG: SDR family oxidoreductase [Cyclobacteriaceae bacterium]|nr:SDR family oxidoreductase [Cyclobacteriaceae bacterium]MDH4295081.1 SDR family oxidoreductase [Cyclobacteriaceae bacterium]MDH5248865.1 SDR family oxidoreductase [Cyclobacteriaceae bacterium]
MKIVIFGNMGYVGPGVVERLRSTYPTATLIGYDLGFFASCLTDVDYLPERKLDHQYFGDIRDFPDEVIQGADAVINLAAISNDPMGTKFEDVTLDVNHKSGINLAKRAKALGVKSFVFASSCSMYGAASDVAKTEDSQLNPLTAYARSKVFTERDLKPLADKNFKITCLRFATACGMSSRLRLDLVLNDFVACALSSKVITILSDGTPWRPLINVKDMAVAIDWAIGRPAAIGDFLAVNTGTDEWNYQVKDLAEAVAKVIPGVKVSINTDAPPDKRSYRVNFGLYKKLAPDHQPKYDLITTIKELKEGLESMKFKDADFRDSRLMRLTVLTSLQESNQLSDDLKWN